MHKLRSMTETIKMLSKENESLRGENDNLLRHAKNSSIEDNQGGKQGGKSYSTIKFKLTIFSDGIIIWGLKYAARQHDLCSPQ